MDKNRPQDVEDLRRIYKYNAIDLKDVPPPVQRPKVIARDGYIFMILLYPMFDAETREVRATEVDFFISANRLVTVNGDGFEPLVQMFNRCKSSSDVRSCMSGDITQFLYALLNEMSASTFPLLMNISKELDAIEERMFQDYEKNLIQALLQLKTNIADIRRALQPHERMIHKLMQAAPGYFPLHMLRDYFDELADHAKEIWETLEVQRETVDALHETNQSLIDFRINEIIKTLTIFSVIILPLTLLAGVFGMNVPAMPIVSHPQAFWILLGLMVMGAVGMLGYFKYRKWI